MAPSQSGALMYCGALVQTCADRGRDERAGGGGRDRDGPELPGEKPEEERGEGEGEGGSAQGDKMSAAGGRRALSSCRLKWKHERVVFGRGRE